MRYASVTDAIPQPPLQLLDRIFLMNEGRIFADGPTSKVVHDKKLDDVFGVRFARVQRDGGVCLQVASLEQDARSEP